MTVDASQPLGNYILDSLPLAEYDRLRSQLQRVTLQQGDVLLGLRQPITQVYFLTTAVVFWLNATAEGDIVEVGITGFEGMVGTSLLLQQRLAPWQAEVQLTGEAFTLSADIFLQALQQSEFLRHAINHYAYQELLQITQSALCHRFHTVEQRLCRWLLATQDRVDAQELLLTRDILAKMIGSTRPAVTLVTATLRAAGLIEATQRSITLLNREEMEASACECYCVLKQARDRYLQPDQSA
jgi:CRP-like cAMP-binding protein